MLVLITRPTFSFPSNFSQKDLIEAIEKAERRIKREKKEKEKLQKNKQINAWNL